MGRMVIIMAEVSICVTTFNRAQELLLTIESIRNQTYEDFELIINDDCSTDNTEILCKDLEKKDSRIKYYKNDRNLKMPGNLNAAISKAKGNYIANLHDGDIYRNDLIEKWKNALDNNPNAAFVFNDYSSSSTFGNNSYGKYPIENGKGQMEVALHYYNFQSCCVWGTVMARKSTYDKYGPFREKYGFISDVDMWLRICVNEEFAYIPEHLIELTPREQGHTYLYPHWRHIYWDFLILKDCINNYKELLPKDSQKAIRTYKSKLIYKYYKSMLILLKHKQYNRIKEGLSIWRDSPFFFLRIWGMIFQYNFAPEWYNKQNYWNSIEYPI
jgi:glycosyltransferase involved in cell wall biosynthesis